MNTNSEDANSIILIYDSGAEKNYELLEEIERLKSEKNELLLRAKLLQERQIVYEKVIAVLWKEMERFKHDHVELEKNILFNFDLLKTGLKVILQETPSSASAIPNDLQDKIRAWLDSHQPSAFLGTSAPALAPTDSANEEEMISTMYSLLQTLEGTYDLSRLAGEGEWENFIATFDADFMHRQNFGSTLLEKFYQILFASSERPSASSVIKNPQIEKHEDLIKIMDDVQWI